MLQKRAYAGRGGRSARLLAGALGSLVLAGFAVPAAASVAWTAPVNVSPAGQWSAWPQVAVDGNGNSVLTWVAQAGSGYVVKARALSASGARGPVKTLSAAGDMYMFPDVAVDNAGDTVFAWLRQVSSVRYLAEARTMSPTGVLGPVKDLTTPGWSAETGPLVAIGSTGTAVINWVENNLTSGQPFEDMARTLSPGGVLGPPAQIYVRPAGYWYPDVAVTPSGSAVFTWVDENGQTRARTMSPAGTLGPAQTISQHPLDQTTTTDQPQAAIDPHGNAVFIWNNYNSTTGVNQIQARRLSASQALGPLKVVASVGTGQGWFPQVAVSANGTATLAWIGDEGSSQQIMARTLSTANVLSAVKKVSALNPYKWASSRDYDYLGLDSTGNATIVWFAAPGVQARTLSATGVLGTTRTLGRNGDPQVAVNTAGKAVATWVHYTQIQAATGP